jgi:exodeoxyribonuclease VII large subunit
MRPLLHDVVKSGALTVSEYASRLGYVLREVGGASLEGEVQNQKLTPRGMLFFSLTDGEASLSCKVFARDVARLEHRPKNGDLVRVQVDRPDFYAANGSLSLIVSELALAGEGDLLRRRAELIARLAEEGLCDQARRRRLPSFPRVVGVISGHGSDGMSDVVKALTDRWPPVRVITCPTTVQGKAAPRQLINALATFQERGLADVIVMARGGGSVQDLACFDDERLCRALFACDIPVVCAIGHTDNNPVCNHVTWSAYTPSRSAELVVPSLIEVRQTIGRAREFVDAAPKRLELTDERVATVAGRLDAGAMLGAREREVQAVSDEIGSGLSEFFQKHFSGLADSRATLAATPRHAMLELTTEQTTLSSASASLARTGERLLALATRTAELGGRVTASTDRQLATHTNDYSRALKRLITEAVAGLERNATRQREFIARESDALRAGADARLGHAKREVAHVAELVAARDFRRSGWLLASKAGQPLRSAADLRSGDRLDLQLLDGSTSAVVEQVHADHDRNTTP